MSATSIRSPSIRATTPGGSETPTLAIQIRVATGYAGNGAWIVARRRFAGGGGATLDTVRAYTHPTADDRAKALNLLPTDH
jgi:hypothetical protein